MYRNVGLNFGRLVAMTFLNLLFGTIWHKIAVSFPSSPDLHPRAL
jgi:hypothetical protein